MTDKERIEIEYLKNKIELLIKEDENWNGKNDRWSWGEQYGVLITANDAKMIVKMITEIKSKL